MKALSKIQPRADTKKPPPVETATDLEHLLSPDVFRD